MATVDPPVAATNNPLALWPRNKRHAFMAAVFLWAVPMLVITALVIHNPWKHTVSINSYHWSAEKWWARESLYIGPSGMNYLPHFAVLYTPFHLLPMRPCEVLWRFCAAAALAGSLWLVTRELFGTEFERPFLWTTILAVPLALPALRNGNSNALFGGITLLAIVSIMQKRWWLAVGWMVLATALKPLGIVLLLLSSIYFASVARRLPVAVVGLAIFPFVFGSPNYVMSQYRAAFHDLSSCAAVTEHRFADLNGILRTLGTPLPPGASTVVRVLSGGVTALAWLWGAKRLSSSLRCLWLYALTTVYLMLFNPMTEENSYVILAPALGAWAVCFLFNDDLGERRVGWSIVCMALCMGLLPNILHPLFGNYFALFWHPLMTILFLAALIHFISRAQSEKLCLQPATHS